MRVRGRNRVRPSPYWFEWMGRDKGRNFSFPENQNPGRPKRVEHRTSYWDIPDLISRGAIGYRSAVPFIGFLPVMGGWHSFLTSVESGGCR